MMQLLNAFSAEQQAIAIYEAQVFWRQGSSGAIFRKILKEERDHRLGIEPYFNHPWVKGVISPFNILAGWVLGTVLSILPRRWCYEIHVWAETQAAETYENTAQSLPIGAPQVLRDVLAHAAKQEHEHARQFSLLVKQL
jgi:rubrerythrin